MRLVEYDRARARRSSAGCCSPPAKRTREAGAGEPARLALRRAAGLARRLGAGDCWRAPRSGLCASSGLIWTEFGRSDEALVHLMEEALAALGPAPTAWRARLLTRLASELCWASDPSRAETAQRRAVDTARRASGGAALASALLGRLLLRVEDPTTSPNAARWRRRSWPSARPAAIVSRRSTR